MNRRLLLGDCLERMRELPEGSVASVVTDPPYGLGFMGKAWDGPGGADHPMRRSAAVDAVNAGASRQGGRQRATDDYRKRQLRDARSYQEWCEGWARECLRVLQPGGFIVAFGGTRTYHRLTAGIEEAGFEIRDTIAWLYGQGFPKHHSLLKPALEPICVARKTGRGSLNTAACAVPFRDDADEREAKEKNRHEDFGSGVRENRVYHHETRTRAEQGNYDPPGRWPANVVLDEDAATMLDRQSGELAAGNHPASRNGREDEKVYGSGWSSGTEGERRATEAGGASRFFYVSKASQAERNEGLSVPSLLTPPDAPGRNDHPTVKPVDLMRWLIRLTTPEGGTVLDPFLGSGTTGIAAALEGFPFVGIEREPDYMRIAEARISHWGHELVEAVA